MRITVIKYTGALILIAAMAGGAVWLGPAGGWTRTGGDTGYLHTTEYPAIKEREAMYWGLAGGWEGSGWRVAGRTSFLPGDAADETSSSRGSWGGVYMDYDYKESSADLKCERRFLAGAVPFLVGGRASWIHASRQDTYYSTWGTGEPSDRDGIVVNDIYIGPSAGWEASAGPVLFGVTVSPGWRRHHKGVTSSEAVYFPNGARTKTIVERQHNHEYLAAQAELAATWRIAEHFSLGAWSDGRQDLYRFNKGDDQPEKRWDLIFGLTPAVTL
jgi:hypothetical protein